MNIKALQSPTNQFRMYPQIITMKVFIFRSDWPQTRVSWWPIPPSFTLTWNLVWFCWKHNIHQYFKYMDHVVTFRVHYTCTHLQCLNVPTCSCAFTFVIITWTICMYIGGKMECCCQHESTGPNVRWRGLPNAVVIAFHQDHSMQGEAACGHVHFFV